MADTYTLTQYFLLQKPDLGSYFGNWNIPLNGNFQKIDEALQGIRTSNSNLTEEAVTWDGATWYGILDGTEEPFLYLRKAGEFRKILTNTDIAWDGLKSGTNSVVDLHSHPGYSSHYFRVRPPTQAADGNTDKQYYAVNYGLFKTEVDRIDETANELRVDLDAQTDKLNGISTDGVNLHIGSVAATGDVSTFAGAKIKAGTTGQYATIGGGESPDSLEVVLTSGLPINFKAVAASGDVELQVNGGKVWHLGNQGASSLMDSDKVDGRDVDDTTATTSNIWTAAKTKYEIDNKTQGEVALAHRLKIGTGDSSGVDGSYFALKVNHDTLRDEFDAHTGADGSDHDAHNDLRYANINGSETKNFKVKKGTEADHAVSKSQLDKKKLCVFQYTLKTGRAQPYINHPSYKNVDLGLNTGINEEDGNMGSYGIVIDLNNFLTQWKIDNDNAPFVVIPILTRSLMSKWMGHPAGYSTKKFEKTEALFDGGTNKVTVKMCDLELHNYSGGYCLYGSVEAVLTLIIAPADTVDQLTLLRLGNGSITGDGTQHMNALG